MIVKDKHGYYAIGDEAITKFVSSKIGVVEKGKIKLNLIEALFAVEMEKDKADVDVGELFKEIVNKKQMKIYITYRDVRRRGLKAVFYPIGGKLKPLKVYKRNERRINGPKINAVFDKSLCMSFSFDNEALYYYKMFWLGQFGVYKTKHIGRMFALNPFETYYMKTLGLLNVKGFSKRCVPMFNSYFKIFREWWDAGYVLKSGFKFGNDFRLYMPRTTPENFEHSKHVIRVFPKDFKIRAEDLSMSIRVAQGVRKTYILAFPSDIKAKKTDIDFYIYDRDGMPKYAVKSFSERDFVDSRMLKYFLDLSSSKGLLPLIAIVDDDTSVTYYMANEVLLEGGKGKYFEIRWVQI